MHITDATPSPPPVFYINMDTDVVRNNKVYSDLHQIFSPWTTVQRVSGVIDPRGGKYGCRRAHMKAHMEGLKKIESDDDYYIVAEDDIRPLRTRDTICAYIKTAMRLSADMVFLEHAGDLETHTALQPVCEQNGLPVGEFYRYCSGCGGWGFGCVLVKGSFGKRLLQLWKMYTADHCDVTALRLREHAAVLFPNPQLFAQREYASNGDDVSTRQAQRPFDFALWQWLHGDRVSRLDESPI